MSSQLAATHDTVAPSAALEAPAPIIRRRRRPIAPYLLLAPTLIFLAVFFAWPMVESLLLAFEGANGAWSVEPIQRMTSDLAFWEAIRNTLLLTAVVVPAQVILALTMSLLLMSGLRGAGLFLYAWAVPLAISDLAAGLVWLSIFTDRGYLNSAIVGLGLSETGFSFLSYEHPVSLFLAVALAETWRATSLVMVILLAGLQVIPKDYGEAAEVFGAGPWARFTKVTLPLLRPSLQVALIIRTILAFQAFAVVLALAGRNLPVLAGEAYRWYGDLRNPNVAAAYALLIMLFSLVNTGIYLRALRVRDEQLGV
ncbi:MAG: sugar ABC transporter permease [Chloroflexota bacterium]|nr:sugar ABC transporter permease [Chloroflexota bacterium]